MPDSDKEAAFADEKGFLERLRELFRLPSVAEPTADQPTVEMPPTGEPTAGAQAPTDVAEAPAPADVLEAPVDTVEAQASADAVEDQPLTSGDQPVRPAIASNPFASTFGAHLTETGVRFTVASRTASRIWVSLFDEDGARETNRLELAHQGDDCFSLDVPGLNPGQRYGLRADGPYDPAGGDWFDPDKLLVDPYAVTIDRPYIYDLRLAARRGEGQDTASLVPKAIVPEPLPVLALQPPLFSFGGLIYEANVRALTTRHPDIPEAQRGTIAAIAHPAIIAHLKKLGVSAIELMPIVAWIDERHLPPLKLRNAWGYNPVTFKPLDPRLAPGGILELCQTVAALHAAGIGVILDLVFNHTGESDELGPTLSLRGLDNRTYYRHDPYQPGLLVNVTGTGSTIACDGPEVTDLILDALRHFVLYAGVDGFRFDLATVLGRTIYGFDPEHSLLRAITEDPMLRDRVLIAEPWDIGAGGYQLGNFPPSFLEWNDRFRDDVRRFWRGDRGAVGQLATRLAGSSDIFRRDGQSTTRSVNFLAAHDGFTLADLVSYEHKHNDANGEENRDGHNENFSWNNGVEGETADPEIMAARQRDLRAVLSTLFASRGTIMLTAGDEFGRTQHGNNNAYAQDNETTWVDWEGRDLDLEAHVEAISAFRSRMLGDTRLLDGKPVRPDGPLDVEWLTENGQPLQTHEWEDPDRHRLTMVLASPDGEERTAIVINGDRRASTFTVPSRDGSIWVPSAGTDRDIQRALDRNAWLISGRSVVYLREEPSQG
jgi:glycogen operon protein